MGATQSSRRERVRDKVRMVGRLAVEAKVGAQRTPCPARLYIDSQPRADDCFLSREHGFLPPQSLPPLPPSHAIWEKMLRQLQPAVRARRDVRQLLSEMPLRSASSMALPGEHLLRAATLLGTFVHACWFSQRHLDVAAKAYKDLIPESVRLPWAEVSTRLNRPRAHLTMLDYTAHNYSDVSADAAIPQSGDSLSDIEISDTLERIQPAVSVLNTRAERVAFAILLKVQRLLAVALNQICLSQEYVIAADSTRLTRELI